MPKWVDSNPWFVQNWGPKFPEGETTINQGLLGILEI